MQRLNEKSKAIFLYGTIYLVVFSLCYSYIFFGFRAFIIVVALLSLMHLPALIGICIMLIIEDKYRLKINALRYIFLVMFIFIPSFLSFKNASHDPRNLFPIFEEPPYQIFLLSLIANITSFGFYVLTKKTVFWK